MKTDMKTRILWNGETPAGNEISITVERSRLPDQYFGGGEKGDPYGTSGTGPIVVSFHAPDLLFWTVIKAGTYTGRAV